MADKDKDNKSSLDKALESIHKQFGKESIRKMNDGDIEPIGFIPTGSISIDKALGVGGIPKGRIVEVYGPESSGKTTLCLHIIAEAQKQGAVAFIDTEHALDIGYAQKLNVDVKELLVSQPDCGEEALDIVDTLVRSGQMVLIVVDSVAALTPKAEIEGEMGQSHMGLQARLMSQALRKLTGVISKTDCAVIFTNQLRSKIGVMFGNPETTTGGNALKYYASVRLDIRKLDKIKDKDNIVGNRAKIKVVKNKVAPPFKEAEVNIVFGVGIDKAQEVLDLAVAQNVIEKAGAWYRYKEHKFQGEDRAREFVKENRELLLKEIVL